MSRKSGEKLNQWQSSELGALRIVSNLPPVCPPTVLWRCLGTLLIFLHLLEETSLLVLLPVGLGACVEVFRTSRQLKLRWVFMCACCRPAGVEGLQSLWYPASLEKLQSPRERCSAHLCFSSIFEEQPLPMISSLTPLPPSRLRSWMKMSRGRWSTTSRFTTASWLCFLDGVALGMCPSCLRLFMSLPPPGGPLPDLPALPSVCRRHCLLPGLLPPEEVSRCQSLLLENAAV